MCGLGGVRFGRFRDCVPRPLPDVEESTVPFALGMAQQCRHGVVERPACRVPDLAVNGEPVVSLERPHGAVGPGPEDAVRLVVEVAETAQACLEPSHLFPT